NAYATAPVCSPSRSCLVTGVYATSLGTQHLRSEIAVPPQIVPFPKLLRTAGYYCSNNFKEDYNFKDSTIWDDSSPTAHWRNRLGGQPFFSVFNITTTHQGQVNGSNEQFNARYGSKLTPAERHDPRMLPLPPFYPDTPMVRSIWARYYDLITIMDKQVGELLAQLEKDSLTQSTIVFFFADHGLGLPRFKRTLYDTGLRVPLIVRVPVLYQKLAPVAPAGSTDQLVSFVDFAPTVLSLARVSIPAHMQGKPFLGESPAPARDCVYGASSRVDEAYEMSRCIRDKRYKYVRNFMPHLPYVQPSTYCDQAEIMQELRRVSAESGMAGIEKPFWQPTKPMEELYDTLVDPIEVHNLAGLPEHRQTLEGMRRQLRDWMIQTRDTGLLPEAEMHIRAAGSTPYDVVQDAARFPVSRILAAAELVGAGPTALPALMEHLQDADSAVRYWAAEGLLALGPQAVQAKGALTAALEDSCPDVRFAAAGALCQLGSCDEALLVLARGLQDSREPVALHAARVLQSLGNRAVPVRNQMESARERCKNAGGNYKNDNYAMFIDWALARAIENCK
ncbi:MAG: sulfatase-like hydrolase/transferase, partial [Sedimentisphaerales bacterium]|nr:sulfatase-like hydrolase/transferase [Sedimentisphaerales bacterium]